MNYNPYIPFKVKVSLVSVIMAFFLNNQSYSVEKVSEEKCSPVYTLEETLMNKEEVIANCSYVIDISLEKHSLSFYHKGMLLAEGVISSPRVRGDKIMKRDGKTKYGIFRLNQFEKRNPKIFGYGFIRIDMSYLGFYGFGLHGTQDIQHLGYDISKGCIRTENKIIEHIFKETEDKLKDTLIIIKP